MNVAGVVNKEREAEKGKSPLASPLKEKGEEKEISTVPVPEHHAGARTCEDRTGTGSGSVGIRQICGTGTGSGRTMRINADFILNPEIVPGRFTDPVQVALLALHLPQVIEYPGGRRYNNARIMRWYVKVLGESAFREILYRQWRENAIDGEPNSRAAAFMAKLYAARDAMKGGAA